MRFYHCSQNSCSISPIPLRQFPLRSPTKTIIIWHSKQIKTLYNQWFELFCETACPKKIWIFMRKCQPQSLVYIKSWGNERFEPSRFLQSSNPVGHMRIPNIVAFTVTFFCCWKTVFPCQRSLTYKYTDAHT